MPAKPSPYLFKGGNPLDYKVFTGPKGTWCTKHKVTGKTIQSVRPGGGMDPLGIANVGLNLLNLGVGIYNAYQLRRVRKGQKEIKQGVAALGRGQQEIKAQMASHFGAIRQSLDAHGRMLEILCAGQRELAERLELVRQEMQQGFAKVLAELEDKDAERRRGEFRARTHALLNDYEDFGEFLGDPEAETELGEAAAAVRDRANNLLSWLESELDRVPKGSPERLPLLVAMVFATRAQADAYEARGGAWSRRAGGILDKLEDRLCNEAFDLVDGRGLWEVGVEYVDVLSQYGLLVRGLRRGQDIKQEPEVRLLPEAADVYWEDGLKPLREFGQKAPEGVKVLRGSDRFPLRTVQDYQWYLEYKQEDPATFDVHSQQDLQLGELLADLGHPAPTDMKLAEDALPSLKIQVLPAQGAAAVDALCKEFGWEKRPSISNTRDRLVVAKPKRKPAQGTRKKAGAAAKGKAVQIDFATNGLNQVLRIDPRPKSAIAELAIKSSRFAYALMESVASKGKVIHVLKCRDSSIQYFLPRRIEAELGSGIGAKIAVYSRVGPAQHIRGSISPWIRNKR